MLADHCRRRPGRPDNDRCGADANDDVPFMACLTVVFVGIGLIFGNLDALAMEPLGHIAGVGAVVVASLSTFMSVPFGALVGQWSDGTMVPVPKPKTELANVH